MVDSEAGTKLEIARRLAIEIARCTNIDLASGNLSHPCNTVVSIQPIKSKRQLPEPWYGNIFECKILFISSNPAIDDTKDEEAEVFPTADWENERIGDWVINRVQVNSMGSGVSFGIPNVPDFLWKCGDGKFRGQGNNRNSPQKTWSGIHSRAVEILGDDASPAENYALTEVVHCKSKMAEGVAESAIECSTKWMNRIVALSTSVKVVVLVGAHVRDKYALEKFQVSSDFGRKSIELGSPQLLKNNSFVSDLLGERLLFIYLPHPTSMTTKSFNKLYGENVVRQISKIARGQVPVPMNTEAWLEMTRDNVDSMSSEKAFSLIRQLGLVKSFDWMAWDEPHPEIDKVDLMEIETLEHHVTRIVRADRMFDGNLQATLSSGVLQKMLRRAANLKGLDNLLHDSK